MDAELQLRRDLELLEAANNETGDNSGILFRTWTCLEHTVVVGRGTSIDDEVNLGYCRDNGIGVIRRGSGGCAVVIGPGSVQYTFILPHSVTERFNSIDGCKTFCNRALVACIGRELTADDSGDLMVEELKVAGLALKRKLNASLVHGSILSDMDTSVIAKALLHPPREPSYRRGRPHETFVSNLGPLDPAVLERKVTAWLDRTCHNDESRGRA